MTIVDLIRHGEPVGGRRYRGQQDDLLSDKGWQQMEAAIGHHNSWQHIISSPLLRCSDFARALSDRYGIPLSVDARLKEIGFGAWEGKTAEELQQTDSELLTRYYFDPVGNRPAGAEVASDFVERVVAAWKEIISLHTGKQVLVVAHAGVIRAVIGHILEMPVSNMFRLKVDNASVSRIQLDENRPPVLMFQNGRLP